MFKALILRLAREQIKETAHDLLEHEISLTATKAKLITSLSGKYPSLTDEQKEILNTAVDKMLELAIAKFA